MAWAAGMLAVARAVWHKRVIRSPQIAVGSDSAVRRLADSCQTIHEPWSPIPWLLSGDAQTIATSKIRRRPTLTFDRELLTLSDGGQVGLDWLKQPNSDVALTDDSPVLLVMHGMSGGSAENYLRHALAMLTKSMPCRCVVMVARGLQSLKLTTWRPYNAGYTEDFRETVRTVQARYPNSKLLAIGYSLGANVLTRYMGQEGAACPLTAAVAVSSPVDLLVSNSWVDTYRDGLFSSYMARGLHKFAWKHEEMLATSPHLKEKGLDYHEICRQLHGVKTVMQHVELSTAPVFGSPSAEDYCRGMSSTEFIVNVKRPFLMVFSSDDPATGPKVSRMAANAVAESTHCISAVSAYGGHVAFLEARDWNIYNWIRAEHSWADRVCTEFLQKALSGNY